MKERKQPEIITIQIPGQLLGLSISSNTHCYQVLNKIIIKKIKVFFHCYSCCYNNCFHMLNGVAFVFLIDLMNNTFQSLK